MEVHEDQSFLLNFNKFLLNFNIFLSFYNISSADCKTIWIDFRQATPCHMRLRPQKNASGAGKPSFPYAGASIPRFKSSSRRCASSWELPLTPK